MIQQDRHPCASLRSLTQQVLNTHLHISSPQQKLGGDHPPRYHYALSGCFDSLGNCLEVLLAIDEETG